MAKILIVDDERPICQMISQMVRGLGHEPRSAVTLEEARQMAADGPFEVVFLDLSLPDGDGLDFISNVKEWAGSPEVIIFTGAGSQDAAELAVRRRAWDYIEKPASMKELALPLSRALQYRAERQEKKPVILRKTGIIGRSQKIRACLDLVAQAAANLAGVLITGQTGTGKELVATAIHNNSPRHDQPFVVVDCAALPENLVESILFGHTKGAFTGADRPRSGLVEQADGGTLFLDEIGDLPLLAQRSFLRVLQERRFRRIGDRRETQSDFRVIAATHRDLDKMVEEGRFRSDLLFRLRSLTIELPPLKERTEDIVEMAQYHLARLTARYGTGVKGLSPEFIDALTGYPWPGNVRELVNSLERALAAAGPEPTLFPMHLPDHIRIAQVRAAVVTEDRRPPPRPPVEPEPSPSIPEPPPESPPQATEFQVETKEEFPSWKDFRDKEVDNLEKIYLLKLISRTMGDLTEAGRLSGLGRSRLYQLLKKHHIQRPH